MGRRLTRKEIKKKDPVTEALEDIWSFYVENRRMVLIVITIAVAVIAVYMVGSNMYRRSVAERSLAMKNAMEIFNAKIDTKVKKAQNGVYPTLRAKYKDALKAFEKLEKDYGSSSTGKRASFYKAICLRELGKAKEAESILRKLYESSDDKEFKQLVGLALAETLRVEGKYDEALKLYDSFVKESAYIVPPEALKYFKAICLDEMGKYKEAYEVLKKTEEILMKRKAEEQYYSSFENNINKLLQRVKSRAEANGIKLS